MAPIMLGYGSDQSVRVTGTRRKAGTLQEEAQAHQSHWPVSDNPEITIALPQFPLLGYVTEKQL